MIGRLGKTYKDLRRLMKTYDDLQNLTKTYKDLLIEDENLWRHLKTGCLKPKTCKDLLIESKDVGRLKDLLIGIMTFKGLLI